MFKKVIGLMVAATLLSACQEEQLVETGAAQQYTVVDDRRKEISFDVVPKTIISLQPSNTEILFSLGVGDKIIGATEYDTYPEEAQQIERISDILTIDIERALQLNPDVVIAYDSLEETQLEQLEQAGLKVFMIESATTLEHIYSDISQLAQVMQVEEQGADIIAQIDTQIADVQNKVALHNEVKTVYYEVSPAPDIWTAGNDTFQHELLTVAGIDNLFADQTNWFQVAEEEVIIRNPEVIMTTANYLEAPIEEIQQRPGWESIEAIRQQRIYLVDENLFSRPATRVGEAVEAIAKMVYPEAFD